MNTENDLDKISNCVEWNEVYIQIIPNIVVNKYKHVLSIYTFFLNVKNIIMNKSL